MDISSNQATKICTYIKIVSCIILAQSPIASLLNNRWKVRVCTVSSLSKSTSPQLILRFTDEHRAHSCQLRNMSICRSMALFCAIQHSLISITAIAIPISRAWISIFGRHKMLDNQRFSQLAQPHGRNGVSHLVQRVNFTHVTFNVMMVEIRGCKLMFSVNCSFQHFRHVSVGNQIS